MSWGDPSVSGDSLLHVPVDCFVSLTLFQCNLSSYLFASVSFPSPPFAPLSLPLLFLSINSLTPLLSQLLLPSPFPMQPLSSSLPSLVSSSPLICLFSSLPLPPSVSSVSPYLHFCLISLLSPPFLPPSRAHLPRNPHTGKER